MGGLAVVIFLQVVQAICWDRGRQQRPVFQRWGMSAITARLDKYGTEQNRWVSSFVGTADEPLEKWDVLQQHLVSP